MELAVEQCQAAVELVSSSCTSFADAVFPSVYALMLGKTQALYVKVFEKVTSLGSRRMALWPRCYMADFTEATLSVFQEVIRNIGVAGCCVHYS